MAIFILWGISNMILVWMARAPLVRALEAANRTIREMESEGYYRPVSGQQLHQHIHYHGPDSENYDRDLLT